MTTPGVGPVVALTYRATVDVPARFRKSKAVGAVFGLTCSKYQSGEIDRSGRISRCGDEMMRVMLYEAAQSMLGTKKWSWLKAWAMQIARRRGIKKANSTASLKLVPISFSGECSAGPKSARKGGLRQELVKPDGAVCPLLILLCCKILVETAVERDSVDQDCDSRGAVDDGAARARTRSILLRV